jgi:dinuclear metal center YbgI/SA1388 family protein
MAEVRDILRAMELWAPYGLCEEGDNCGLLAGNSGAPVEKVLVALDATGEVINEAREKGAQMIVTHHPVGLGWKNITDSTAEGRRILLLAGYGIAAVCMHTNLDSAENGVNDELARILGLPEPWEVLKETGRSESGRPLGLGRAAKLLNPEPLGDFALGVKEKLGSGVVRLYDAGRDVRYIAVSSGSGSADFQEAVSRGCDTFVTGDVKYHTFLEAREMGINLIDAGHFPTEHIVCKNIVSYLSGRFEGVEVMLSEVRGEPFTCL